MRNLIDLVLAFLSAAAWLLFLVPDSSMRRAVGDEPHYLVIAESLERYHSLDITQSYLEGEMSQALLTGPERHHSAAELAGWDGVFGEFHAFGSPNGLFSIHNLGLPLLMTPVIALGGTALSAKMVMLLIAGLLPVLAWASSGLFFRNEWDRLLVSASLVLVMPFLIGAAQIYPDLLGGLLISLFLFDLFKLRLAPGRPGLGDWPWLRVLALVLLPWLHIRLAAPALLCLAATVWLRPPGGRLAALRGLGLPLLLSLAWLAAYNFHAFGALGGSYDKGSLEFSVHSLMVLIGLHLDQFQGTFLEAPILLFALIGLAGLLRRDWRLGGVFLFLYGSLVVPNALHPNWYGGGSYVGRFSVAGAVLLIIAAAQGLALCHARWPRTIRAICAAAILYQIYAFTQFCTGAVPLFNQSDRQPWLEDYRTLLGHTYWLPALYRVDLALRHWPNLGWLLAVPCLLLGGWRLSSARRWGAAPFALALAFAAGGSIAGSQEAPLWLSVPRLIPDRTDFVRTDLRPKQALRILFGEAEDEDGAILLWRQLADLKVEACIDGLAEADSPAPAARCPATEGAPWRRVAVSNAINRWHLTYLDDAPTEVPSLEIDFSKPETRDYMTQGWSITEGWGVWSESALAELVFDTEDVPEGDLRLDVKAVAYVPGRRADLPVPVTVDGQLLAVWRLRRGDVDLPRVHHLWIPGPLVRKAKKLTIRFGLEEAVAPRLAGESPDYRRMGIGPMTLTLGNADR